MENLPKFREFFEKKWGIPYPSKGQILPDHLAKELHSWEFLIIETMVDYLDELHSKCSKG